MRCVFTTFWWTLQSCFSLFRSSGNICAFSCVMIVLMDIVYMYIFANSRIVILATIRRWNSIYFVCDFLNDATALQMRWCYPICSFLGTKKLRFYRIICLMYVTKLILSHVLVRDIGKKKGKKTSIPTRTSYLWYSYLVTLLLIMMDNLWSYHNACNLLYFNCYKFYIEIIWHREKSLK